MADLGTAVVLFLSAALVFIVAGLDKRFISIAVIFGVLAGIGLIIHKPYRLKRVVQFVDPQYKLLDKIDPKGHVKAYMNESWSPRTPTTRWTSRRSRSARAALTGLGLMQGRQKLLYLPEAHTDMIYAVVGEEFGLFGTSLVLIGIRRDLLARHPRRGAGAG